MPRIKIDAGLFEPLVFEVGDKVYTALPFSLPLVRAIREAAQAKPVEGEDEMSGLVKVASIIFGISAEEAEKIDVRVLTKMVSEVTDAIYGLAPKPSPAGEEKNG